MAQVIYNGNSNTGGSPPTDNSLYAPNATFNVAGPGNLSLESSPFFYWNTKADGTGNIFGQGSNIFPNQTTNLTLFAIWGVTTGLTNGGVTTHFNFFYDPSLAGAGGIEPARINQLLAAGTGREPVIENDFDWLQAQFAGVDMTKARPFPIPVQVTAVVLSGYSASWGWPLSMNAGKNPATLLRCMAITEVSETFMLAQDKGWGFSNGVCDEESCGEALSLFLAVQFQLSQGLGMTWFMNGTPSIWLNTSLPASNPASREFDANTGTHYGSRQDYVGSVKPWAGNGPATGCCMAFLYYLFHQLQFTSIPQIIAAAPGVDSSNNGPCSNNVIGSSCLKGVYRNLTGDNSDPFPYFASLLAVAYPPNQVASIPGPNFDDPWPLGSLSYVGAKTVWGKDEINDVIAKGGTYSNGFFIALDGFSLRVLGATMPSVPTIAFQGVTAGLSATLPNIFHQSSNPNVPQQILFAYDLLFANPLSSFPAMGETPAAINSSITVLGKPIPATTEFLFTAGATPYFTNVVPDPANPNQLNVPWLSEDLRVFTATPGESLAAQTPVPGGPQFVEKIPSSGGFDTLGAYGYIQALLIYLNQNFAAQGSIDPFAPASNVIPQQDGQLDADSSVKPFTTVGSATYNNYSFAIARVRLKGIATTSAANVKAFFRAWGTQTADTGWDPVATYPSQTDGGGHPIWPKAPADDHTIPFFATSQQPNFSDPNDPEFKKGGSTNTGANNQTIAIQTGDAQWAYFGCYLDVNDPSNIVNGTPIWQAFPGNHHCLVAEIAFAGTPIQVVNGVTPTPEGSGLLAQRNMQVTMSDNPGPASAHQVPQTFAVRPSALPPAAGPLAGRPDELVIFWGDTPAGATARIYWPAVAADVVVALADWMYGVHPLRAADPHTIEVKTLRGVTFVPIPVGAAAVYAGLLSIDLPQTVKTGQEFNVVVRRVGKRLRAAAPPPPASGPPILASGKARGGEAHAPAPARAVAAREVWERYIVGSFQVKIPVSARLEGWPWASPWYPVLERYVGLIARRLQGVGGDPAAIPPSLGGYRPGAPDCEPGEGREVFRGRVASLVYDGCGHFCAFVLDTKDGPRRFATRGPEIERVVNRAWAERILATVFAQKHAPHCPDEIVLHSPSRPLTH